jgi:hypothetical protein
MRFLSSRIHGIVDYLYGVVLIFIPWIMGFGNIFNHSAAMLVPVLFGCSIFVYSIFTNYDFSLMKAIPFNIHLWLDIIGGIFLAVSPWLFKFHHYVFLPHLTAGVFYVFVAFITHSMPSRSFVELG